MTETRNYQLRGETSAVRAQYGGSNEEMNAPRIAMYATRFSRIGG